MDPESSARILIVDDVAANRETLVQLLDSNAYQLDEAADGFEALKIAAASPPDLILLDVMMPGIDGYEVCRRVRADQRLAEIPVVMITALDDQASRLAGIEAGADDFITKPYNSQELRARVRTISRLNRFRRLAGAQERIREQASLLDEARDAIIVQDTDDRITYWNKSAERVFGWPAEKALTRSFSELLTTQLTGLRQAREKIAETGEWNGQLEYLRDDGRKLIIESRWTLLRNAQGRSRGIMMINTDVTEAKRLEQQFLRMQRVQSLGSLAGGIAHDLNNVLAPILMAIELLRMSRTDPGDAVILETIESSAKRGTDLVKQVLTFVRGVQGQKTALQAGRVISEIATVIRETFPKSIRFSTAPEARPWLVHADATQLHQILMNLCVNARDAMPNGGTLKITTRNTVIDAAFAKTNPKARTGAHLLISVGDSGTGIPAKIRERIFEPFFTTKTTDKGTGLGLATVCTIIENHGGFLIVESEEGKGSEFKVYLPAINTEDAEAKSEKPQALPAGNGELVLVVDDESAILGMARQILETFGYKVMTASEGGEAISMFAQHHEIKVVVTDLMMPGVDGTALIKAAREMAPNIKIIAETGSKSEIDTSKIPSPVNAWLEKPFTAERLLTSVHQVLSGKQDASG